MYKLSFLIPARNEQFLGRTVQDLLENTSDDSEILVGLDGVQDKSEILNHPRVNVIYVSESIGQRAMTKTLGRLSTAKYIAKCDAHCSFEKGFDTKMLEAFEKTGDNVVMTATMRNLHGFDWKCNACGWKKYQGPTPLVCPECGRKDKIRKKMMWIRKPRPESNSFCFDQEPHFQYFNEYSKRPEVKKMVEETGITETMSLQGSFFMMTREKYFDLDVDDESFGSWGSQGILISCKTWLSGGRVLVNHSTNYAHLFRTQGGDFGFPYEQSGTKVQNAKKQVRELFYDNKWSGQILPLSFLIERFWPIPGWSEDSLNKLKAWPLNK